MPRIPATIAVVMLVATCIGFNTARFPVVLEMAAVQATSKQPRLIIPVEDSEPPADQSTDDQPGDESTDDQPGDESNDYRSGGKSSDYRSGGESSDYRSGNESKRAGQPREVGDADWDDSSGFEGNRSSGELPGSKTAPRGKGRTQKESKSGKSARPVVASMGMAAGEAKAAAGSRDGDQAGEQPDRYASGDSSTPGGTTTSQYGYGDLGKKTEDDPAGTYEESTDPYGYGAHDADKDSRKSSPASNSYGSSYGSSGTDSDTDSGADSYGTSYGGSGGSSYGHSDSESDAGADADSPGGSSGSPGGSSYGTSYGGSGGSSYGSSRAGDNETSYGGSYGSSSGGSSGDSYGSSGGDSSSPRQEPLAGTTAERHGGEPDSYAGSVVAADAASRKARSLDLVPVAEDAGASQAGEDRFRAEQSGSHTEDSDGGWQDRAEKGVIPLPPVDETVSPPNVRPAPQGSIPIYPSTDSA